jgi:hypothetical protein
MAYIYIPDKLDPKKDNSFFVLLGLGVGALAIWYFYFREKSNGKSDSEKGNESWAIFNKNPLNIKRSGIKYPGEITPEGNTFKQFETWEDGILGAIIHLNRYHKGEVIKGRKLNTIRKIISTWAPSYENDTNNYIAYVSKQTGINADTILNFEKRTIWGILKAMANREDGKATKEVNETRFLNAWNKFENLK